MLHIASCGKNYRTQLTECVTYWLHFHVDLLDIVFDCLQLYGARDLEILPWKRTVSSTGTSHKWSIGRLSDKPDGLRRHFGSERLQCAWIFLSFFRAYSAGPLLCPQYVAIHLDSGLSPGSHEAKVQRAKVCLNCMEPSVARSSCWSLPVGQYLSDTRCKGSVVVLARWTASNMAKEPQTSVSHLLVSMHESGSRILLDWQSRGILFTVCPSVCLLPNLWARCLENKWTDVDASWRPVSVALSVTSQYALPGYGDRWVWVRGPVWPDHCVRL